MKNPSAAWLLAIACPMMFIGSHAQQSTRDFDPLGEWEEETLPRQIRVQAEFIEMPNAEFTRLMRDPREGMDDTNLRKLVEDLVEKGKATVIETLVCTTRSGQRSTAESVREFIYPTEYEPAELPLPRRRSSDDPPVETTSRTKGPTPTAFETRNLGATLEIEPIVSETGKIIDLRLAVELADHVGNETWGEWIDDVGDVSFRMPTFYTIRLTTSGTFLAGQPAMLAAATPRDDNGLPDRTRKIMCFVRCEILVTGK